MEFDAVLLQARRAESIAKGWWHDRTINDDLDACVAACPDKLALTAVRVDSGEVRRFSYRELAALWAWRAWASAATTWSRCSCRTGGSSACCTWRVRALVRC